MVDDHVVDASHQDVEDAGDDHAMLETPLLENAAHLVEEAEETCENDADIEEQHPAPTSYRGQFFLAIVSFLFATLNVSLRLVYSLPDPPSASVLSTTRGWMAVLCFLPFLGCRKRGTTTTTTTSTESPPPRSMWIAAAELAGWNFACQAMFNVGLITTPSARASFLGQTSVVMVPLICFALFGEKLTATVWFGCSVSVIGLIFLSYDSLSSSTGLGFGMGDLLILGGSLCWSIYVIRTSALASFYDEVYLQGTKTFFLSLLYTLWFLIALLRTETCLWSGWDNLVAWAVLAYSALGPGTIADLLQQKGQETVAASQSNLILCMEPVFTLFLGRFILGEETSWLEKLGGSFLILGAMVAIR